jgi:hypothetical protein
VAEVLEAASGYSLSRKDTVALNHAGCYSCRVWVRSSVRGKSGNNHGNSLGTIRIAMRFLSLFRKRSDLAKYL